MTPGDTDEELLADTARSLLGQSFQAWEWLVGAAAPEDPRVRPLVAGVEPAGDYVLRLVAGDLLEPTALEYLIWFLESQDGYELADSYTVEYGGRTALRETGLADARSGSEESPPFGTALVRVSALERAGAFEALFDEHSPAEHVRRCTEAGLAGGTVPLFLVWNRAEAGGGRPPIGRGGHRATGSRVSSANAWLPEQLPFENLLSKPRPRLLLVVPWLTVGGADAFNLALLDELSARDWEATVAATLAGPAPWLSRFARRTPDVFLLPSFLRLIDVPRFLCYLIRSRRPDAVLVSNSELGYRLLPYLRARCPEPAYLDFCHSEDEGWNSGGYPRFSVEYHELLDLSVTASEHLRRWMIDRGADPTRVEVAYVGVRTEEREWNRDDARGRAEITGETPIILFVGRISDEKQPQVLIATLAELKARGHRFQALVVGGGPGLEQLRKSVRRARLGRAVRFVGAVEPTRVRELMADADVFFLPSRVEGISLAIYEAMASGLAVVAARIGGQAELVTPECGILVPVGHGAEEVGRYADALGLLLDDAALAARMGAAGRARVRAQFRRDQMGDRMVALLRRAVELHDTVPRPAPSAGLARAWATEAVEYSRLLQPLTPPGREAPLVAGTPWKIRTLVQLARVGGGFYRFGVGHGMTWLVPLKERIRRALAGPTG